MNEVFLIGRITKDLELKDTGATKLTSFNIAINKPTKNGDAVFVPCIAFREVAENLVKYQKKGNLIAVKGSINQNEYTDKEGNKRYSVNVIAKHIQFLESNNKGNDVKEEDAKFNEINDEDIPF